MHIKPGFSGEKHHLYSADTQRCSKNRSFEIFHKFRENTLVVEIALKSVYMRFAKFFTSVSGQSFITVYMKYPEMKLGAAVISL